MTSISTSISTPAPPGFEVLRATRASRAGALVSALLVVFLAGRRAGQKKSTVVEIRRL